MTDKLTDELAAALLMITRAAPSKGWQIAEQALAVYDAAKAAEQREAEVAVKRMGEVGSGFKHGL